MGQMKELHVLVSESVAKEVDQIKFRTNRDDSEVVNEALKNYLRDWRRMEMLENMRNGYEHMATINLQLAEMGLESEAGQLTVYESNLALERD